MSKSKQTPLRQGKPTTCPGTRKSVKRTPVISKISPQERRVKPKGSR